MSNTFYKVDNKLLHFGDPYFSLVNSVFQEADDDFRQKLSGIFPLISEDTKKDQIMYSSNPPVSYFGRGIKEQQFYLVNPFHGFVSFKGYWNNFKTYRTFSVNHMPLGESFYSKLDHLFSVAYENANRPITKFVFNYLHRLIKEEKFTELFNALIYDGDIQSLVSLFELIKGDTSTYGRDLTYIVEVFGYRFKLSYSSSSEIMTMSFVPSGLMQHPDDTQLNDVLKNYVYNGSSTFHVAEASKIYSLILEQYRSLKFSPEESDHLNRFAVAIKAAIYDRDHEDASYMFKSIGDDFVGLMTIDDQPYEMNIVYDSITLNRLDTCLKKNIFKDLIWDNPSDLMVELETTFKDRSPSEIGLKIQGIRGNSLLDIYKTYTFLNSYFNGYLPVTFKTASHFITAVFYNENSQLKVKGTSACTIV